MMKATKSESTFLFVTFKNLLATGKENQLGSAHLSTLVISTIKNLVQTSRTAIADKKFCSQLHSKISFIPIPFQNLRSDAMDEITLPIAFFSFSPKKIQQMLQECFRVLKAYGKLILPTPTVDEELALADHIISQCLKDISDKKKMGTPTFSTIDSVFFKIEKKGFQKTQNPLIYQKKELIENHREFYLSLKEEVNHNLKKQATPPIYGFWELVIEYYKEHPATKTPLDNIYKIKLCWKLFAIATTTSFKEFTFFQNLSSIYMLFYALAATILKTLEYYIFFSLALFGKNFCSDKDKVEYSKKSTHNYIVQRPDLSPTELNEGMEMQFTHDHYHYITHLTPTFIIDDLLSFNKDAMIKEVDGMKNALIKVKDAPQVPYATPLFTLENWSFYYISTQDLCKTYYEQNEMKVIAFKP